MNRNLLAIKKLLVLLIMMFAVAVANSIAAVQDPSQTADPTRSVLQGNENRQDDNQSAKKNAVETQPAKTGNENGKLESGQDPAGDLASVKFAELMKRFEERRIKHFQQMQKADPKDQVRMWSQENPLNDMAADFFALVESFPDSPKSLESLSILISQGSGDIKQKAVNGLIRRYVNDEKIIPIIGAVASGAPSPHTEKWLREIATKSTSKRIQARALQAEIEYIQSVRQLMAYLEDQPEFAERAGQEMTTYLENYDMEKANRERISLLNRLSSEFADTESGVHGKTYADLADQELYIINQLGVGKVAPEIEGKDLFDSSFKLSDYRGKVVVVWFWGNWCTPATKMYPQFRSWTKKLKDKPFAIVGVNSDPRRAPIQKSVKVLKLDWRSFWDGGKHGPIAKAWKVKQFPTVYVLDGNGVIRHKEIAGPELDEAITGLLAEMGHNVDLTDHSDGQLPTPTLIDQPPPRVNRGPPGTGG